LSNYPQLDFFYDGNNFIELDRFSGIVDGFHKPPFIVINDYPPTNYLEEPFEYNGVHFDTKGSNYNLIQEYKITDDNMIYQYVTTGTSVNYEIWTYTIFTEKNWKGILSFDINSVFFINTIPKRKGYVETYNIIYNKISGYKNLNILYNSAH
jgi:hypothetical protein